MLPLKTLLYLGLFGVAFFASIFKHPIIGVYAYLATYNINPLGQWWGNYLPGIATRYAMLLAMAIGLGILFQRSKLRFGQLLERQEILFILFICILWLSVVIDQGSGMGYNIIKMTKVAIVLLMATHIVTTRRFFEGMVWVFILSGLYLSYELHSGVGVFVGGRFDAGVGGSDFGEGNFLAAHFSFVLPFVGVLLLKGNWKVKISCLIAAALMVNTIILLNSRGAFLAMAVGCVMALLFSARLKKYRKKILLLLFIGLLGGVQLTHEHFWTRMATIQAQDGMRDSSAQGRLEAWDGAWEMAKDYPLGVGVGNFFSHIGNYYPALAGRDTHNTYLRCLAELGFQGFFVLLFMILTAFLMLRRIDRAADQLRPESAHFFHLYSYACKLALVVYLCAAMFVSSTYIEEFYWLLMLPVFLKRALDNEFLDSQTEEKVRETVIPSVLNQPRL